MTEINNELKGAVESIIFINEKPVSISEIQNVLEGLDADSLKEIVTVLQKDYDERHSGIKIVEVAGGYQMVTSPTYATFIKKFYNIKRAEKLSMPSLESLAIIAYKQPVTRVEIEQIRGVNVDGVMKKLLEKGLIRVVGRKEVAGRPFVYGTTRSFLEYFGLNSINELPDIEELVKAMKEREDKESAEITPIAEGESTEETAISKSNEGYAPVSGNEESDVETEPQPEPVKENSDATQTN